MLKDALRQLGLSPREADVAVLVTRGFRNKEVADRLFVTEKTIKFHLTNIYKKLKLKSRAQLIIWAMPQMSFEEKVDPVPPEPEITMPAGISRVGSA